MGTMREKKHQFTASRNATNLTRRNPFDDAAALEYIIAHRVSLLAGGLREEKL